MIAILVTAGVVYGIDREGMRYGGNPSLGLWLGEWWAWGSAALLSRGFYPRWSRSAFCEGTTVPTATPLLFEYLVGMAFLRSEEIRVDVRDMGGGDPVKLD